MKRYESNIVVKTNLDGDVETGGDNTALVEAADELHNDLAGAVVVNDLELTNIT